ncbi:hypothetical protein ACFQZ2_12275 [Streptomonospora algeriensis]|uniref:Uncharacterized protein n=1 Tax=Streptomonospora algeriensis TaxID=995084 RepID=A0ABW3BGW7_9ACTN
MERSGEARIHELAEIDFTGRVGTQVTTYAKKSRKFARDLASELETGAEDARQAMKGLKGHPALMGVDVRLRARRVARKLRRAQELAKGISAESVKFASEYRKQFIHAPAGVRTTPKNADRKVDL